MYDFNLQGSVSSKVVISISSIDVHICIFTDVLMAHTFMFMPVICWSLFSVWLLWDNQSAMYRSGPGLYIMGTLSVNVQHDAL